MMRSPVMFEKQMADVLLAFPELVKLQRSKSPAFLQSVMDWIDQAEQLLQQNRHVKVAELAGLKSRILSPERAADFRGSLRKAQQEAAAGTLYELQRCLQQVHDELVVKSGPAREVVGQILAMVADSGVIRHSSSGTAQQLVEEIWQLVSNHEQLKPMVVGLKGKLSQQDIQMLMIEEVRLEEFME